MISDDRTRVTSWRVSQDNDIQHYECVGLSFGAQNPARIESGQSCRRVFQLIFTHTHTHTHTNLRVRMDAHPPRISHDEQKFENVRDA